MAWKLAKKKYVDHIGTYILFSIANPVLDGQAAHVISAISCDRATAAASRQ
jgi:hypothetical protein